MRSDFVANVSHEIRSPLTALSGFVESLQDSEGIDEDTRDLFLGLMAKETERMKNLVSDLLSLLNVEVKESRVLTNSVNVAQVLEQANEAVSVLVDRRGKRLDLDIEYELPPILGKIDDLVRVFINLLENALNYSSDNGSVYLTANAVRKDNPLKKPAICITVRDEGEGAAGLAAQLTLNPLEAVTTITTQIVTLLTGDQEFDSAKTLSAFALGLLLFVLTLILNVISLRIVKKSREQYD
ncbi:MAG: sensor histidine kinase [Pikeienuella sp.]